MKNFNKSRLAAAVGAGVLALGMSQSASAEVSISGWINEAGTYADNGDGSDIVQLTDNGTTLGSRITFAGSTEVVSGLEAGFEVIMEPSSSSHVLGFGSGGSGSINGTFDESQQGGGDLDLILGNSAYVSGAFGKVTLGLQSMPTDNIAVLADPSTTLWSSISPIFRGNGVNIGNTGGAATYGDLAGCMTAPGLANGLGIGLDCNGIYRRGIRYDLPTFVDNLNIAVGYANDDVYDVAAKYNTQLGRVKTMLHVGYAMNNGPQAIGSNVANQATINANPNAGIGAVKAFDSVDNFQVQLGLMDPNTGLFGTFAYQKEDADLTANAPGNFEDSTDAFWGKIGVKRKFNSLGDTSFAFQYGQYSDQYQTIAVANPTANITGSELERIGLEVNQYFGSNLILYGVWENLSVDADGTGAVVNNINGGDDLDTVTVGLTYFF